MTAAITVVLSALLGLLGGSAAGAYVTNRGQRSSELRVRRMDAAADFMRPVGAARVALLELGDVVDVWVVRDAPDSETGEIKDVSHIDPDERLRSADDALDEAQLHSSLIALVFSEESEVYEHAVRLVAAYRNWWNVYRVLPLGTVDIPDASTRTDYRRASLLAQQEFTKKARAEIHR